MSGSRADGRPKWRQREIRAASGAERDRRAEASTARQVFAELLPKIRADSDVIAALAQQAGAMSRAVAGAYAVTGRQCPPGLGEPLLKLVGEA